MQYEKFAIENAGIRNSQGFTLHDFSIRIYQGSILGIICNTLLEKELIIDLFDGNCSVSGTIRFNHALIHVPLASVFHSHFFLVDPKRPLNETMSIQESICLPISGFSLIRKKSLQAKARRYLEHFHISLDLTKRTSELTPKEHILVQLLQAYAIRKEIIVLHNLATVLSQAESDEIFDIVDQLCREGFSFVIVNSPESFNYQHAKEFVVIKNRTLIGRFPAAFCSTPEFRRYIHQHDSYTFPLDSFEHLRFDGSYEEEEEKPVLEFQNVSSGKLRDLSFVLYPGSIAKFFFLDSASLDAFKNLILQKESIHAGRILYQDQPYSWPETLNALSRDGILFCPEIPYSHILYKNMTVLENIQYGLAQKTSHVWYESSYKASIMQYISENIGPEYVKEKASALDPAVQTAVAYHKILLQAPKVVFFERPFYHTDSGIKSVVQSMFSKFCERGISIVILTTSTELLNNNDGDNLYVKDGVMISEDEVYQELYGVHDS